MVGRYLLSFGPRGFRGVTLWGGGLIGGYRLTCEHVAWRQRIRR